MLTFRYKTRIYSSEHMDEFALSSRSMYVLQCFRALFGKGRFEVHVDRHSTFIKFYNQLADYLIVIPVSRGRCFLAPARRWQDAPAWHPDLPEQQDRRDASRHHHPWDILEDANL